MSWPDEVDALNEIKVVRGVRGVQGEKPGGRVGEGASGRNGDLCASRLKRRPWPTRPFAVSPNRPFANHLSLPLLRPPSSLCCLRGHILRRCGIALIQLLQHQASRAAGPDFVPPMVNHEIEIIAE